VNKWGLIWFLWFVCHQTNKQASIAPSHNILVLLGFSYKLYLMNKFVFLSIRIISILKNNFLPFTWYYFVQLTPKQLVSFTQCYAPYQHILLHIDMSMSFWAPCFKWTSCQSIFNCFFLLALACCSSCCKYMPLLIPLLAYHLVNTWWYYYYSLLFSFLAMLLIACEPTLPSPFAFELYG
jgi:hypothetical protein